MIEALGMATVLVAVSTLVVAIVMAWARFWFEKSEGAWWGMIPGIIFPIWLMLFGALWIAGG